MAASKTERNFVRIYWVHLAVVDTYLNVACVRTGERTLFHAVHDTLNDSRDEACVDGTTNNTVVDNKLAAPFEVDSLSILNVHLIFLTVEAISVRLRHAFNVWFYD